MISIDLVVTRQKQYMARSERHDHPIEKWIAYYARLGYGAKGVIYASSGALALLEAFDFAQGKTVGSTGALEEIALRPFGKIILIVISVSLMGYVVWRIIQAVFDPEHSGKEASDILRRLSYACSGAVYAGVAYSAIEILDGVGSESSTQSLESRALWVMTQPLGRWLVAAGGLMFCGIGCYYFYRSIRAEFRKRFKLHHMSDVAKTWATIVGRVGIAARGVVYLVIGMFAVRAAWEFDPKMIMTTEAALSVFDENPTDEFILATLGIGFIAYGIHMFFQARYRSIDPM